LKVNSPIADFFGDFCTIACAAFDHHNVREGENFTYFKNLILFFTSIEIKKIRNNFIATVYFLEMWQIIQKLKYAVCMALVGICRL